MERAHLVTYTAAGALLSLATLALSCSGSEPTAGAGGAGGAGTGAAQGSGGNPTGFGGNLTVGSGGQAGGGAIYCPPSDPAQDDDADGFSEEQGDCNDCDPNTNPGAFDVVVGGGDPVDEDCDGAADNSVLECDGSLAVADADPKNGARAIELCHFTDSASPRWGVIWSAYVKADGWEGMNPLSHGLLPDMGPLVVPQKGKSMLALSCGTARRPSDGADFKPHSWDMGTTASTPDGFPTASPFCGNKPINMAKVANDSAALELQLRVPTNAHGLSYRFNFYSNEWPNFVCSDYNDFFVAIVSPPPPGSVFGNISFDENANPIAVNNGFVKACSCPAGPPCQAGGISFNCPEGATPLLASGFEKHPNPPAKTDDNITSHAATMWLKTQAPVEPGSIINVRFAVWDAVDHNLDSTVLIDQWEWIAEAGVKVNTVDVPK